MSTKRRFRPVLEVLYYENLRTQTGEDVFQASNDSLVCRAAMDAPINEAVRRFDGNIGKASSYGIDANYACSYFRVHRLVRLS